MRTVPFILGTVSSSETKDVGSSTSACFGFIQIPCIIVGYKDHVDGAIRDTVVGVGSHIVKEHVYGSRCVFSGCGLLSNNGTEGDRYFFVHNTAITQEGYKNTLDTAHTGFVERGTSVAAGGVEFWSRS